MALPKNPSRKHTREETAGVGESPDVVEELTSVDEEETVPDSSHPEPIRVEGEKPKVDQPAPTINPAGYATTTRFKLRNPHTGDIFYPDNSAFKPCKPKRIDGWLRCQLAAKLIAPL